METEMFGPHDVEAGHDHSIAMTAAALDLAIKESTGSLPVYYTVIGLMRAAVRLGVVGLGPLAGGMEPMFRLMLEQERRNAADDEVTVQ